ncbi:MAG TPA: CheR family methyltransferase, partial [Leptospiraceae bacterium]|nr:CheR family methyltransferase [Leptospiraceae bacterium]
MTHLNLTKAIYDLTGIHLQDDKLYLLESRLGDILKKYSLNSFDSLAEKIQSRENPELLREFINSITTQETYFFRDSYIYEAFAFKIMPDLISAYGGEDNIRLSQSKIKIWSAGCATGQEPYSIAILIRETFPNLIGAVEIIASDISLVAIEKAKKGIYLDIEVDRGIDDRLKNKYFKKVDKGYEIDFNIRSMVRFIPLNLHTDQYPREQDVIFCRNVAIYFTKEDRKRIYTNLQRSLKAKG